MPSELPPQYLFAPMTGRRANSLAHRYGFRNHKELAAEIPENGLVADIGSGGSPLGSKVAGERPDITWVNFDYRYDDPAVVEKLRAKAPANVEYIAGDILDAPSALTARRYDRMYSFWLLPHLMLEDSTPGEQALDVMLSLIRDGGVLRTGPTKWSGYKLLGKMSVESSPTSSQTPEERAAHISELADRLTPEASTRLTQRTLNVIERRERMRAAKLKSARESAIDVVQQ